MTNFVQQKDQIMYKINNNEYTKKEIEYVLYLHRSGNDAQEIAEYLDWSFWTVSEILKKFTGK